MRPLRAAALLAAAALSSCLLPPRSRLDGPDGPSAAPAREFRGLWVATMSNIDWPSRPGLSAPESQAEALRLLDLAVSLSLNAVLLQVRPAADAFYDSSREPVSAFLTGAQGERPGDWYDPLAFWVEEAHARGLELHAWMNPFRAGTPSVRDYAPGSPVRARPELVRSLGDRGFYWLDPGMPEARDYVLSVAEDLLRNYAVDGLVVDDYFYPYPEYLDGAGDFPDDASFARWKSARPRARARSGKADFRRESATAFLRALAARAKIVRPDLRVGVSPFGIWRPGHPTGTIGKDAYEEIFADSRAWLREKNLDFFAPQLYWPVSRMAQSYPLLLGWWLRQERRMPVWPSILAASPSLAPELRASEAVGQIMILRAMEPESPGFLLYGARYLLEDPDGVARALREGPLAKPAVPPAAPRARRR